MAEMDLPELLVPRETAKTLRTTTGNLANRRSQGLGPPFVKLGGRIFYPKDLLVRYIAERIVDPSRRGIR